VKEEVPPTTEATLDFLQQIVGGYIERVKTADKKDLIVNEDGLMMNLPYNRNATLYAGQKIVGDAVLLSEKDLLK
jgi:hypothetical protein